MYKYLSLDLVLDFVKSYFFIHVLYFLRNTEVTYYYYKAVKLAYYYSTGYLFNTITKDDSVYIVNIIIQEKRWFDIGRVEIVHAIYNIISFKYNKGTDLSTTLYLYMLQGFTLWNIVCLLKLCVFYISGIFIICCLFLSEYYTQDNRKKDIKRYITALIIYLLLLLDINDLVISVVFVFHPIIYYIFEEFIFFIRNIYDIKKVLSFYNKKDKRILKTQVKCVDNSNIKDNEYVFITKE